MRNLLLEPDDVTLKHEIKFRYVCAECGHTLDAVIKPYDNSWHRSQWPPDYEVSVTECPNCKRVGDQ